MINIKHKRCQYEGCNTIPNFGNIGGMVRVTQLFYDKDTNEGDIYQDTEDITTMVAI